MYTLRTVAECGTEVNNSPGSFYRHVNRFRSTQEFEGMFARDFGKDAKIPEDVLGYVEAQNGALYTYSGFEKTYIMTDGGATFAKLN